MNELQKIVGTQINHRYQVERQLGEGGQGAVFEVLDLLSNSKRALKICADSTSFALQGEFFKLFEMRHPHLATVYDFQTVDDVSAPSDIAPGTAFFTEELVIGMQVDKFVRSLPEESRVAEVARIGIGVARALRMLHSRGILHLDVKPSNIIVDETGQPRLIDLGLARSRECAVGMKVGTLGYMGKEVFDGLADNGTDIFALGRVLIQLISGEAPPVQPGALVVIPASVPQRFAAVLRRMTDENLAKRYNARESILAITKSGVVARHDEKQYLDDASDSEDALSRFAIARSTRFVGRKHQAEQLTGFLEETFRTGRTTIGVVQGPVGVGKTRLVRKMVAAMQVERAQRDGASVTFMSGTMRSIIEVVINIASLADAQALRHWLKQTEGGAGEDTSPGDELHMSEKVMGHLFAVLASQKGPTVVLVEEATESWVAMALHFSQETAINSSAGLALIFEISHLASLSSAATEAYTVELEPLSLAEEIDMVEGITCAKQDSETMALFHRRTGGNPRFAEALVEQSIRIGGQPRLEKRFFEREMVERPEEIVAEKLLANAAREDTTMLSLLAVAATPLSVEELRVAALLHESVIVERFAIRMKNAGYLHVEQDMLSLVPFVAAGISSLLAEDARISLHRQLLKGMRLERPADQLGTHAFYAKEYDIAAKWLRRAVDNAIRSGDMVRAIQYLEMLRECDANDVSSLLLELATCYRRSGKYPEALQIIDHLKRVTPNKHVALEDAATKRLDGDWKGAKAILRGLVDCDDSLVRYTALALMARIHLDNGELSEGIALLQGVDVDEATAHRSGIFNVMGLLHLTDGEVDAARHTFEQGLAVVKGQNPIEEARYCSYLGMVAHTEEQWENAAKQYENAFWLADEYGDSHGAATYVVNWAAALTEMGDMKHALIRYRNGMNRMRLVGRPEELVQTEANYAQLLLRLGDVSGAINVTENMLDAGVQDGSPLVYGNALTVRGEALVANGAFVDAVNTLKQAQAIFTARSQNTRQNYCGLHLAGAFLQQGKVEQAATQLETINDPVVSATIEYFTLRVQLALQGKGNLRYEVDKLLLAFPDHPTNVGLDHYKAMCVAVSALHRLSDTSRWTSLLRLALNVLTQIRERTPALHRPAAYPYEEQMRVLSEQSIEIITASVEEERENQMKHLWMERLMRITARLNSELNVDAQLDIIMDTAVDVTDAERGFLLLREENGSFSIRSARNMDSEGLLKQERNYSNSIARRAFERGEPIVTTNAQEDEQFREYRSVATLNLMYIVAVPLLVKGRAQGTIYLDSTSSGKFDGERIELLKVLANQAAIALTNARLVSRVKTSRAQIENLNQQLTSKLAFTEKELEKTRRDLREMNENLASKYNFYGIIGASKPMTEMFRVLERIAPTDIPVVIGGESGTGKELVAKAIHQAGPRKKKAFVAENCAAIPSQLLESILFGHVRGAFTGAVSNRSGLFVEADGGTLFLDEIAEMPLEMQSKLLRVLQEGEVRPVGQNHSVKVNVRILVASNADLKQMVKEGRFREDLFYRLHVMEIKLPPLRDRSEDIAVLANYFVKKHAPQRKIEITKDAMELLLNFRWPGNVRQLENEIIRATVMSGSFLDAEHLSDGVREVSLTGFDELEDLTLEHHMNTLKKQLIKTALRKSRGNRSKASEILGISRYGLQKMMTRLDMNE